MSMYIIDNKKQISQSQKHIPISSSPSGKLESAVSTVNKHDKMLNQLEWLIQFTEDFKESNLGNVTEYIKSIVNEHIIDNIQGRMEKEIARINKNMLPHDQFFDTVEKIKVLNGKYSDLEFLYSDVMRNIRSLENQLNKKTDSRVHSELKQNVYNLKTQIEFIQTVLPKYAKWEQVNENERILK